MRCSSAAVSLPASSAVSCTSGDLEQDPRVGGVAHLGQRRAEQLDRPHQAAAHRAAGPERRARRDGPTGSLHQLGRHQRQETVAEVADQVFGERPRVAAQPRSRARPSVSARPESRSIIASTNSSRSTTSHHLAAGGGDQLERRQRVAGRAAAPGEGLLERGLVTLEPGVGGDPAHVLGERVGRQQVELEVLGAADRIVSRHLLRVGRRQHEHDVRRRLLERLEQRRLGRLARACGPRRGCTPCGGRACRATPSRSGRGSRRRRCWSPRRVRGRRSSCRARPTRHDSHSQHGSPSCGFSQLSTLARIRAEVVLPVPRGPENRYAWPSRPRRPTSRSARTTWSWPFSSLKRRGR